MFVTAVCFLFLLKLKWPKNKNIYDVNYRSIYSRILARVCAVAMATGMATGLVKNKAKKWFLFI